MKGKWYKEEQIISILKAHEAGATAAELLSYILPPSL